MVWVSNNSCDTGEAAYDCIFQVKTNSALFPKIKIENILKAAQGGTSIVMRGKHSSGVPLLAVGYKYNEKTVLQFICASKLVQLGGLSIPVEVD